MTTIHKALEQALGALKLVMDYPEIRQYLGSQVSSVADTALTEGRKALEEQAPSTSGERASTAMDVTIEDDALSLLHDMVAPAFEDDKECTPVRLLLGDGHSGYGLYAASADYPEEGAVLLAAVKAPAALLQSPALPAKEQS